MRQTDVVIVGGGLAGSVAAAMLGRKGIAGVLVDPHEVYPPELRCEKIDQGQIEIVKKTGLGDVVFPQTALASELDVVRMDRLIDRKPGVQRGIMYDKLVNTIRSAIPEAVERIKGKVNSIETSDDRQTVALSTGEEISARLVILANGLNLGLRENLGFGRNVTAPVHSITVAFDVKPVGRAAFPFQALTYYPRRTADRYAYLTLFPVQGATRANFMLYRDMTDPWFARVRKEPREAMLELIPGLEKVIGPFEVTNQVWVRPADLYQTTNVERPGIVVVGDAFATSCPAAGTGSGKVYNDVEILCNRYVPEWLGSDGMASGKIAAFYADADKRAYDAWCLNAAHELKSTSIDPGPYWALRRWAKFMLRSARGLLRRLGGGYNPPAPPPVEAHS